MSSFAAREVDPHELTWCGAVLVVASAALPWLTRGGTTSVELHPVLTAALRPSALLLVMVVVVGAVAAARYRVGVAVAGSAGMLWMVSTLAVWSVGLRLQDLTPAAILPDGVALRPGIGVTFGVLGGFTLVFAAFIDNAKATWPVIERYTLRVGRCALVLVLSAALLASRGLPWVRVDAGNNRWSLGADAVPIIAEVMTLVVLSGLVVLWTWAFMRRRWSSILLLSTGVLTVVFGLISAVGIGLLSAPIGALLRRLGVTAAASPDIGVAVGPWALSFLGAAMMAVAIASLWRTPRSDVGDDRTEPDWSTTAPRRPRYGPTSGTSSDGLPSI